MILIKNEKGKRCECRTKEKTTTATPHSKAKFKIRKMEGDEQKITSVEESGRNIYFVFQKFRFFKSEVNNVKS